MELETLTLPLAVSASAFNSAIGVAAAGVAALVGAMAVAVKATFTWADELDSIQDVLGVTNEEAAALNFTLHKSGVSTETFNKSLVIMNKGLVKADGSLDTIGKAMANWGIDVKDANGNLKSQTDLIGEVSKKYGSFSTQQEKINFLTEVFGKGGAEMVDFFDTLSAEGGIDAVTQKVKDFGLVIDPQRYENFTRSLEEMKLVGLGLAVGFTEKLMPVFEGLLGWVNSLRGLSLTDMLSKITIDFSNLGARFSDWAKSIDWAKVSADLIAGIGGIDWATLGTRVHDGFKGIFDGLKTIINGTDWQGLFDVIGLAFADFVVGLSGGENWASVKATWSANLALLNQIVNAWWANLKATWSANWAQLKQIVNTSLTLIKSYFTSKLSEIKSLVSSTFESIKNSIINAIQGAVNTGIGFIANLAAAIMSIPLISTLTGTGASGVVDTEKSGFEASGGYPTGTTWVGENGPELVNLPSGSYVNNAVASRSLANQPMKAYIDYDELGRVMGRVLGQELQRR